MGIAKWPQNSVSRKTVLQNRRCWPLSAGAGPWPSRNASTAQPSPRPTRLEAQPRDFPNVSPRAPPGEVTQAPCGPCHGRAVGFRNLQSHSSYFTLVIPIYPGIYICLITAPDPGVAKSPICHTAMAFRSSSHSFSQELIWFQLGTVWATIRPYATMVYRGRDPPAFRRVPDSYLNGSYQALKSATNHTSARTSSIPI